MLAFMATATHENVMSEEIAFGRYLILRHCGEELESAKTALAPKANLGVVRG
jgi:hypothetical protein